MEQRLFFDRIDMHRTRVAIGQTIKRSVHVDPGSADAAVTRRKYTSIGANTADDLTVTELFIKKRFVGPFPESGRGITLEDLSPDIARTGGLVRRP
jgi:hypothetical protein